MEMNVGNQNVSVAVFDSGIGGLNLLKECATALPSVNFYYLADNFNVPYGTKGRQEILSLVKSKFESVKDAGLSAAVVACNTATANCIEELRDEFDFPIIGIQPAVKPAARYGGKSLVLATTATVNSVSFKDLLERCSGYGNAEFIVHPCIGLADYIEKNVFSLGESLPSELLPEVSVDSVVLGCTHYVFIKDIVQRRYKCTIFDGITGTVDHLRKILGMSDHFQGKSGVFNCEGSKKSNITFLEGDFIKNARIYSWLINKEG